MISKQLCGEGIKFILVKPKDKFPLEDNWQNDNSYLSDDTKLLNHIKNGGNYGVRCGGGLIVIDADTIELNKIVLNNFSDTFTVKTKSGQHYYFFCIGFDKKKVLKKDGKHLGEIQSTGTFVVGPGSIHPSGIKYEVIKDIPIKQIDREDIDKVFKDCYSGDRLNKDVIIKGATSGLRNESMFKLACSFREKDLTPEETYQALNAINKNNNPPLPEYELKTLIESAYSYAKQSDDVWVGGESKTKEKENKTPIILKLTNYTKNVKEFYKHQPFFYDKSKIFWLWNLKESKWEIKDDIDVMNAIEEALKFGGETVTATIKNNYLEAFKRVGRLRHPKPAKDRWIQFRDKAFSLRSKLIHKVTSDFFFCNPIPWELGESTETPVMDKLFEEWVGKDFVDTLYEIISYCCYPKYPIQTLFCLHGIGRNGKTCFINLLRNFLGDKNICSVELDDIAGNRANRFATFKLYKKLACFMGETNFGLLTSSAILKKLTGGDIIGFEKKRADPFDDFNYAKIIIASNSLPSSLDTSEGFYRRWIIIDFPNQFKEGKDILENIPQTEYRNLVLKVTRILPKLLNNGKFTNQGTISERKNKYIMASNPLPMFIEKCCKLGDGLYVSYNELYTAYIKFLQKLKKRKVSRKEFKSSLEDDGLWVEKSSKKAGDYFQSGYWVEGVELILDNLDNFTVDSTLNSIYRVKLRTTSKLSKLSKQDVVLEENDPQDVVCKQEKEENLPDFLQIIEEKGKYSIQDFVEKYGEAKLTEILRKGEAYESPRGYIQILK